MSEPMSAETEYGWAYNAPYFRIVMHELLMEHGIGMRDPYHCCVTLKVGAVHRYKIPNFVVVSHACEQKPRFKWIAPLPASEPVTYRKTRRKTRKPVTS